MQLSRLKAREKLNAQALWTRRGCSGIQRWERAGEQSGRRSASCLGRKACATKPFKQSQSERVRPTKKFEDRIVLASNPSTSLLTTPRLWSSSGIECKGKGG